MINGFIILSIKLFRSMLTLIFGVSEILVTSESLVYIWCSFLLFSKFLKTQK